MADETPRKKKRRKKRPAASGASREGSHAEASSAAVREAEHPREVRARRRGRALWLTLLAVGLFELWLFGRRGAIEVCVAREGEHDFALLDQPRSDENTRRYPTCERRLNVGLRSHYDERAEDAMLNACRRATILRGRDATIACALKEAGWQHRVEAEWVAPWQKESYERLLWFLF